MHHMMGGFAGFFMMRLLHGLVMRLLLFVAIGAAIYFYLQWQKERARNGGAPPGPWR